MARSRTATAGTGKQATPSQLAGMPGLEPEAEELDGDEDAAADGELLATEAEADDGESDNVGDASVEINVESLIAELESEGGRRTRSSVLTARRKLENFLEERRFARNIEDFEDFDID